MKTKFTLMYRCLVLGIIIGVLATGRYTAQGCAN